jgi:hypothetical protein
MFMDVWACHNVHNGKKIMCHYGLSSKRRRRSWWWRLFNNKSRLNQRKKNASVLSNYVLASGKKG